MAANPVAKLPDNWPAMSIEQANALMSAPGSMLELVDSTALNVPMKRYAQAPDTIRDMLLQSQQFGDKDHLVYEGERVSFIGHFRAVAHFAHVLRDRFGVEKGDRVAVVMRNYPQWPVAFFGAMMAGAIVTPMNSWWTGDELHYGLADCGAKVVIVDGEIFERLSAFVPKLPMLERIVIARDEGDERHNPMVSTLESYIGAADSWSDLEDKPLPDVPMDAEDDTTIMYTSGTTGKPKGALGSHLSIISNILHSMASRARAYLRRGEMPPAQEDAPQVNFLLSIPFFHATGAFAILIPSLVGGSKIVAMRKWDVEAALKIIETEKITHIGGVPAIAWQVLEHPDRDKYDLSSIVSVAYGGAPSAPELVATIKKHLPAANPSNGWGMTETSATSTTNFGEDYINRPDSAGAAVGAVELRIVGANGQDMPVNEVGELWVKSPANAKGYWNKPEATAETFRKGWVVTGDLATLDEEGFMYIVDRAKDMLIRGGENIYCIEVENTLYEHPAVMDASIVGIPDKVLGEEVGAVVQLKPGTTASIDALRAHVATKLASFKVPKHVIIQDQPLPRNANGKILKSELKKLFV